MLLFKAHFVPPVISLDDILRSIATNYFENYVTWKSKPLHVLSCEDIPLNLINLFILKLSFILISVLLLRSWSWSSEVWCIQMISWCVFTVVSGTKLRRREKKIEVRDVLKKLPVQRQLETPECNRQNIHRNYWTRYIYLEPPWFFWMKWCYHMVESSCCANLCLFFH